MDQALPGWCVVSAVPPHDLEAEESILGAALLSDRAREDVLSIVRDVDYYRLTHGTVHRAIARLDGVGEPVDAISVADCIEATATAEERELYANMGGRAWIHGLASSVVGAAASAHHHAKIVRRHAQARAAIDAGLELVKAAHDGGDPETILGQHARRIDAIAAGTADRRVYTIEQVAEEWVAETLDDLATGGMRTGWPTLDEALNIPIKRGEAIGVAARSGVGKTFALIDLACHAIENQPDAGAVFVSLEMPRTDILERIASQTLDLPSAVLRKHVEDGGRDIGRTMIQTADYLSRFRIWDEPAGVEDLPRIISATRRTGVDPAVVCVDYLGMLDWNGPRTASTYERVSETVRAIKGVARRERVVLLNAVQLNRNAAAGGTRPTLDMLRDSGAIEESMDRIVSLWAPSRAPGLTPERIRALKDVVLGCWLKNRKGSLGEVSHLLFTKGRRLREVLIDDDDLEAML